MHFSAGIQIAIVGSNQIFVDHFDCMEKLPKVAELAVGDACTGSNPRSINPDQMAKLLKCCYYDEEVDF